MELLEDSAPNRCNSAVCLFPLEAFLLNARAYASAYALALLQFAYASLRNSGFGLREGSYDKTLSTHVKGGLGRRSADSDLTIN